MFKTCWTLWPPCWLASADLTMTQRLTSLRVRIRHKRILGPRPPTFLLSSPSLRLWSAKLSAIFTKLNKARCLLLKKSTYSLKPHTNGAASSSTRLLPTATAKSTLPWSLNTASTYKMPLTASRSLTNPQSIKFRKCSSKVLFSCLRSKTCLPPKFTSLGCTRTQQPRLN
jgi:hypothetical protein